MNKEFKRFIYTRLQVDVGADRGFLPGSDGEKLYPYIAPFLDNLDAMSETVILKIIFIWGSRWQKQKSILWLYSIY